MTIQTLIAENSHNIKRRAYLKRRLRNGGFEADWQEVSWIGDRERVIKWGSFSQEVNYQPGEISAFDISELQMEFDNSMGHWNIESNANSLFFPPGNYLTRRLSKLKIEEGFIDPSSGTEVGTATIFEGAIDKVEIDDSGVAKVTILPYSSILTKYDISDLALTGAKTISTIVNLIMNQSKIIEYIPYVAAATINNRTVQDCTTLSGSYWDVLKQLAYQSSSLPAVIGPAWSFAGRTPSVDVKWDFVGRGGFNPDILEVNSYDDEGADRVRVYWKAQDSNLNATSTDALLLAKYLGEPQEIDLSDYNDADKQEILDQLLQDWQRPKPIIEFTTKFLLNLVQPLYRVTIKIQGGVVPTNNAVKYGSCKYGDGSQYAGVTGGIRIRDAGQWMITRVQKDIDNGIFTITAERIVN